EQREPGGRITAPVPTPVGGAGIKPRVSNANPGCMGSPPIPTPEGGDGARPLFPQIFRIEFNPVHLQEPPELFLERILPVVGFLVGDVASHVLGPRLADGERA